MEQSTLENLQGQDLPDDDDQDQEAQEGFDAEEMFEDALEEIEQDQEMAQEADEVIGGVQDENVAAEGGGHQADAEEDEALFLIEGCKEASLFN
ncbi:hypothetical protein BG015_006389 [Linnemannia schmuckeri]|uniref:Uncharacterized protein n=1 Tax=Linnemannia schmuckeri TaxID=64567 RepID=A0A9P5S3C5_9FUNG|nr:hypothetical protein BG015_006389 [Linnemannia schmuckeri]